MFILHFIPIQLLSLLMQSTNPSDQRINYNVNRQRPLQKSLVLPDHFSPQNLNAPKTIPLIPDFAYQPMKRSSTTLPQNTTPLNLNTSQYSNSFNFATNSAPSSSTLLPQHSFDQRAQSQHELLHHPGTSSLKNLNTMARSNIMSQQDNKNFYKQKKQNLQLKISNPIQPEVIDIQMIVNEVAAQIKKDHLPNMIRSIKKEFLDDLHHYRVEFQIFKDEVKAYQAESQEMLNWFKNNEKTVDNNVKKEHHHSRSPKSPKKQKELELQWIEAQFFALEERLNQYQTKVYDSINQLNTKFETEIKQKLPKISLIKSTFPPFTLEYKESFIISNPIKTFPEISISQSTYYIDKFGYLLDQDNHYLLDNRGNQIKIEERHLRLLEQHRIISK